MTGDHWKPAMKGFTAAIAAMGLIRFSLNLAGVADSIVKYFSMTVILIAGLFYFAIACTTHKDRLKAAYWLVLPYMIIEVLALGYTWSTGHQTIFHTPEYSLGFSIGWHTFGHLVGGLTWEPLFVFLVMETVWAICAGGRLILNPRATSP